MALSIKKELVSKDIVSATENSGVNYADAVQWCLRSIFSVACPGDGKVSQCFQNAIIIKLEGHGGMKSSRTVSDSETVALIT